MPSDPEAREALARSLFDETSDTHYAMTMTDARDIAGRMLRGTRGKALALPDTGAGREELCPCPDSNIIDHYPSEHRAACCDQPAVAHDGSWAFGHAFLAALGAPSTDEVRRLLDDANNVVNTEWANGNVSHGAEARILNALNKVRLALTDKPSDPTVPHRST